MFEKPVSPRDISGLTGGAVSEEDVRSYCRRGAAFHPLPHIRKGTEKKQRFLIRPSVFEIWWAEEERLTVGMKGIRK